MNAARPSDGRNAIEVRELSHQFFFRKQGLFTETSIASTRVFDDLRCTFAPKEFVSIVGASGCGKTTLLRIIGGLIRPTSGRVVIGDRPVEGPPDGVAFVFQHTALLPWRNVLENVGFGKELRLHRKLTAAEKGGLRRWLELVGLTAVDQMYPRQLSGGMQQRVGLARALATEPGILLMDEPFGALDALTRANLQDELLRIQAAYGATVVFITHDIEEALYLSDRVLVMRRGQPSQFVEDVKVPFSRSERATARLSPEFAAMKARLGASLGVRAAAS